MVGFCKLKLTSTEEGSFQVALGLHATTVINSTLASNRTPVVIYTLR